MFDFSGAYNVPLKISFFKHWNTRCLRHAFTRAIDSYATLFLKVWKIYVQAWNCFITNFYLQTLRHEIDEHMFSPHAKARGVTGNYATFPPKSRDFGWT